MRFDWDQEKARSNLRKHGVSFEQAMQVFTYEDFAIEYYDEQHSDDEERFITIGPIRDGVFTADAWPL